MKKHRKLNSPKKVLRGQKVIHRIKEPILEEPYVHKKLTVCKQCGGMGFVPFMKTIGSENLEYCKCTQCGKEHLCEWWERKDEQDESTITECEDGCKI